MGFSNIMMAAAKSIPKSTISQSIPSFKNGPDSHGFLKHNDGSSQVHTKVNHLPVNSFLYILLLLNNKHVVVEELLKFLVDKVDGDLFKAIVFKDLKTSNIKHSTEVSFLEGSINQSIITLLNEPLEDSVKDGPGNTCSGTSGLFDVLSLGDPLSSDLDPGLTEGLDHCSCIHPKRSRNLSGKSIRSNFREFSLLISALLDVDNATTGHDTSSEDIAVKLLLFAKSKNIEGILGVFKLFIVVN